MSVTERENDGQNNSRDLLSVPGRKNEQINVGSDIDHDFECDPCAEEGHRFEAQGFCSDCNHYLCKACYTVHRRPVPTRNHKLLDRNEMPKIRPKFGSVNKEVIEVKCDVHVGKVVEFYCENHDTIGCSVCMTLDHKSCNGVRYVPELKMDKDEVEEVIEQLSSFDKRAKAIQTRVKTRMSITKDSFDAAQKHAMQFSKELKEIIDRLEKEIERTIQKEQGNKVEKMHSAIESLEESIQETEYMKRELTSYLSMNKQANSFIAMKKAEKLLESSSLENRSDLHEDVNEKYVFTPNTELVSLQQRIKCLGCVEPSSEHAYMNPSATKKVKIKFLDHYRVNSKDDSFDCVIVGILEIYEPVRDIVADAGNKKVKVIKGYANTVTASLNLSSKPHAMAKIGGNKVCVTIPEEKKILLISISKLFRKDIIKVTKVLSFGFKCYGITKKSGTLFVTCEYEGGHFQINCLNFDGQILNRFECGKDKPLYIAAKNKNLYTLDIKHECLKRLSLLNRSLQNERTVQNISGFSLTENFLVVAGGFTQGIRICDHDFQDFDAEENDLAGRMTPCSVKGQSFSNDFFVGYRGGQVLSAYIECISTDN